MKDKATQAAESEIRALRERFDPAAILSSKCVCKSGLNVHDCKCQGAKWVRLKMKHPEQIRSPHKMGPKKVHGHDRCPCGSGKYFKNCCRKRSKLAAYL